MSTKVVWKDIDLSMEPNIYNDVGILTDVNAVSNALVNRITIDANELPFYNGDRQAVNNYLHGEIDYFTENEIIDIIKKEANTDKRIKSVSNINVIEEPNSYQVRIESQLTIDLKQPKAADMTIYITRE